MAGQSARPADGLGSTLPVESPAAGTRAGSGSLQPEQDFGGYRILGRLGKGGMGAVYEALQRASGRRVALKVLDHSLDTPEARKRFLREGRLAASISHPNSVYVFGTEEIDQSPVIVMELVSGGTLQDRVQREGPPQWAVAVDMILQVIEGLQAAQSVGVLHRDVKPANCFVDADGTVKVGDFGLSISTAPRDATNLTSEGTFLGTPAFSSPEQIRGDELDVRSDIYSVGVTLFYLLTGEIPFPSENYVQLLARVLETPAPSPQSIRSEIPRDLARVVQRCLQKQPGNRYRSYEELRRALTPFSSAAPTPATLGLRFVACAIDGMLWMVLVFLAAMAWFRDFAALPIPDIMDVYRSSGALLAYTANTAVYALFFGVPEAIWGRTLGKWICGLRVVGPDRRRAGFRALPRAAIYVFLPQLAFLIWLPCAWIELSEIGSQLAAAGISYTSHLLLGLMFVTVRRRNGFAAVHDLLTGTRVIRTRGTSRRPSLEVLAEPLPQMGQTPTVGPYFVLSHLTSGDSFPLQVGYDVTLLRRVWIRRLADDAPDLCARGTPARPGRLRWLTGNRSPGENWDAYEAPPGQPLCNLLDGPARWNAARYWLLDLARELNASLEDDTLPDQLGLDRIWITADGHAKLLDFPAPGIVPDNRVARHAPIPGTGFPAARTFLNQVALATIENSPDAVSEAEHRSVASPLPLHAKRLVDRLPHLEAPPFPADELAALTQGSAAVTRNRRWMILLGCGGLPLLTALILLFGNLITQSWVRQNPEVLELRYCLERVERLQRAEDFGHVEWEALQIYIPGRFGQIISNPQRLADASIRGILTPGQRRLAEQILADRGVPSEKALQQAERDLSGFLADAPRTYADTISGSMSIGVFVRFAAFGMLLIWVTIPSVIAALLFRGGAVVHLLGVAFVRRDGSRASRRRVFYRSLIAWSPCILAPLAFIVLAMLLHGVLPESRLVSWGSWLVILGIAVPAVVSACLPDRAVPDRLAGTYMVPR